MSTDSTIHHQSPPTDTGKHAGRSRVYVTALLVGFWLIWANWRMPVVRFAWQPANLATFILALGELPTAAIMALELRPRWFARVVALVLALESVPAVSWVWW